nr:MAG TPA: hypothetical protein [Caudoviricetes sp.]
MNHTSFAIKRRFKIMHSSIPIYNTRYFSRQLSNCTVYLFSIF